MKVSNKWIIKWFSLLLYGISFASNVCRKYILIYAAIEWLLWLSRIAETVDDYKWLSMTVNDCQWQPMTGNRFVILLNIDSNRDFQSPTRFVSTSHLLHRFDSNWIIGLIAGLDSHLEQISGDSLYLRPEQSVGRSRVRVSDDNAITALAVMIPFYPIVWPIKWPEMTEAVNKILLFIQKISQKTISIVLLVLILMFASNKWWHQVLLRKSPLFSQKPKECEMTYNLSMHPELSGGRGQTW